MRGGPPPANSAHLLLFPAPCSTKATQAAILSQLGSSNGIQRFFPNSLSTPWRLALQNLYKLFYFSDLFWRTSADPLGLILNIFPRGDISWPKS